MNNVVVFFASPTACSAMADFSVSPCLVAALCSFIWVLSLPYIYTGEEVGSCVPDPLQLWLCTCIYGGDEESPRDPHKATS